MRKNERDFLVSMMPFVEANLIKMKQEREQLRVKIGEENLARYEKLCQEIDTASNLIVQGVDLLAQGQETI